MDNNSIYRKLYVLFGFSRNWQLAQEVFRLGGLEVTRGQLDAWRRNPKSDQYREIPTGTLIKFFNGLFQLRDLTEERGEPMIVLPDLPNAD